MLGPDAHTFGVLREYFQHYGYWTIALMLLLENAGVPAPGQLTLLCASCLSSSQHELRLPIIVVVGVAAAVLGTSAGYAVGYFGGRLLLERYLHSLHISQQTTQRAENFLLKHAALSIFSAKFINGMRELAGPLAGTFRMPWWRFLLFNFLDASAWVPATVIIGSLFGSHLDRALRVMGSANLAIAVMAFSVATCWWWKRHRSLFIQSERA
jgi:membrane protein DedA with SNARE-associated domain